MDSPDNGISPLTNAIQSSTVNLAEELPVDQLQNRTVLITGGASGIGAALSSFLAKQGANVIIGDINERQGTEHVAQLRLSSSSSSQHHFIKVDVSSWESQVALFKTASSLSPHGGIDCVIANAGINDPTESEVFEINIPRFSVASATPPPPSFKALRVNLDGVMYTSTLALSWLSDNPGSEKCSLGSAPAPRDRHLLLVSSIAGLTGLPGSSIYTAAKHGVVGLFRSLRITAPILHGVRVNMLCPQYVETPILGVRGNAMLLGVAKTQMDDVVDAAARLVADKRIIGRALLAGARASQPQIQGARLGSTPNLDDKGAIWDVYGHDFEQSDLLIRRVVSLLNLVSKAQGWSKSARDGLQLLLVIIMSVGRLIGFS